ncbi:MAG: STM4015 family protein [Burkholderiales bacterium]|nr:STM4015 family protein [Opitutaceae bacterium]
MKRQLVYMDAKSSKFWNIELNGSSHTVTYGRIGTLGQSGAKTFPSPEAAQKDMDKLVREKLAKGYTDAAGAGADASGIAGSADGQIPLIAFSSINRREDASNNAGTFIGKRVVDYDPEKPARTDVAYRFRSDYDENKLIPNLTHFLATEAALETKALIIGAWHGDDPELTPAEVIKTLVGSKSRLPKLAALYVGDITSEENEMSWIKQCDLSPLLDAFPGLQFLRSRGGDGLAFSSLRHASLRALTVETGGLDVGVIRSICMSELRQLEYLELWLGTDEYGANHTVADLQPILSGQLFPNLKYLGLRNSQLADEIAAVVVNSPLIQRLETLDLSLGVLTDEGARSLLKLPASPTLKRLNLHYNFIGADLVRQLKTLPLTVDASKPSDQDSDDDEWRFVAVGE